MRRPETSLISIDRDLIRSLPVRSTSGLPVYVAASPAAPFSTTLRFARNDNHVVSIAPKNGPHGRAVGSGNLQRQRREIIDTQRDSAEIERFNDCNAGTGKRVMVLQ